MDAVIRAHRILSAIDNYHKASPNDDWLSGMGGGRLGKPIGYYRNPGQDGEVIGIFVDGLAWYEKETLIQVRFCSLTDIAMQEEKESMSLILTLKSGEQFNLPIKGRRERFFDSMEFLRFLDRVMKDCDDFP